jgi:hypothetical protein
VAYEPNKYRDRELQFLMPGVQTTIAKAADYDRVASMLASSVALLDLATEACRVVLTGAANDTAGLEEVITNLRQGRDTLFDHFAKSLPRCYTCRFCGSSSEAPDDVEQQFCRHCRFFRDGREQASATH